jgi:hypothetical protein
VLAIQAVCNTDSEAACEKVRYTEGGKFVGSTFGGAFAGWMAKGASVPICAAIGAPTAGLGGVLCVVAVVGTGAWVGTTVGATGGEEIGEVLYETTLQ